MTYAATSSSREVDPAAFFQLGMNRAELSVGEDARTTGEKAGKSFRVENGDGSFALSFYPPAGKD